MHGGGLEGLGLLFLLFLVLAGSVGGAITGITRSRISVGLGITVLVVWAPLLLIVLFAVGTGAFGMHLLEPLAQVAFLVAIPFFIAFVLFSPKKA